MTMAQSRTLSRADRYRIQALARFKEAYPNTATKQWGLEPGDDERLTADDLPTEAELFITWRYDGMLIAEETVGTGMGQFRHQYVIVLHARRGPSRTPFSTEEEGRENFLRAADTLAGALRENGFKAIFLAEVQPDDDSLFSIGLLAERL